MPDIAEITRTVVEAYSVLDFDIVASHLHENFVNYILPASLGRPARSRAEYLAWIVGFKSTIKHLNLEILELLVANDATTLHLRGHGEFINGEPYLNEYMVIFRFEGDKIVAMKEFVDSAYVLSVQEKMRPRT